MAFTNLILSPPFAAPSTADPTAPKPAVIPHNLVPKPGSLESCKSLHEITQLHGRLAKQGLLHDPAALKSLIVKYSQLGSSESLEHAEKVFEIFKNGKEDCGSTSGVYVYNSLIKGNSSAGSFSNAILLYVGMVIEGVAPDNYSFPFVLSACARSSRLFEGMQLHGSVMKLGFYDDIFVLNSLIHFYGECGEIDKGRKVFDEMSETNVVSWTSLICGYARENRHREAVSLFFQMVEEGIKPNEVTMASVISACAELGDSNLAEKISSYAEASGLITINTILVNALVDMYLKCGAPHRAKRLFDECVDRNLILYNTVLSNYVKLGKVKEALDVLREMLYRGPKPDKVTMLAAISSSAELSEFRFGRQCHAYVLRNGLENWDNIGNSLIDMYTKCGMQEWACRMFDQMPKKTIVSWNSLLSGFARNGDIKSAKKVFEDMPEKDLVSWNSMIGALVQQSLFRGAIELFNSMQNEGITPDKVTMVSIASACGYLGALDLAKWIYNYIQKVGIPCDMQLSTSLVDMLARCGDPNNAMKVFRMMKERDVSAWTAAIGAMTMEGNGGKAIELFNEMLSQGVEPDEVVYAGVLTACSHSGLVDQGMHIFKSMKEHGMIPHIIHYGCIVDLLGRAGLLDEALDFIKSMPTEPNDAIWSAFLAACRVHKDQEMAALAADMLSNSAKEKTGIQVLLSNIYAAAGKWDDVAKVRTHMKVKGMKKKPGSSSIEVNGVVYEFTSGDEFHPENALTASMLEEMKCRLGEAGYLPDVTNVLLDVDEQEKQFLLGRHSEKLAIAFGLISSGQGMPIRVVKNLRMCSDCHSFAKIVSKVYCREIVIRDNNRFHFFGQGLCSCGDYW
ncbi:pentatricopeptide repeat-containing protein At3g22690 [Henckelia pumila]|uniref:pentatricopeptide repeat-containing protein At3g22690 n=1 Tax=Henckelia pumila TaxID=405737 RepID=UPI003C6E3CCD